MLYSPLFKGFDIPTCKRTFLEHRSKFGQTPILTP